MYIFCTIWSLYSSYPSLDLSELLFYILQQIFNSKLVLASPETASDADYAAILGVIGHEVCY